MKGIIISLIILICMGVLVYTIKDIMKEEIKVNEEWFIRLEKKQITSRGVMYVYYDKETKVQYGYTANGGLTLLVDQEGKPLLYEERSINDK